MIPETSNRADWPRLVKIALEKLKRKTDEQPSRAQAWFNN